MKIFKLGLLGFILFLSYAPTLASNVEKFLVVNSISEERKLLQMVNLEREKRGLDNLIWNSKLADLARSFSQKMANENFFSHFDSDGNSVVERAKGMKINRWKSIGENLFMSDSYINFTQTAIKGWMKSTTHRENILNKYYDESGIGIAKSKDGKIFVTQVFMQK